MSMTNLIYDKKFSDIWDNNPTRRIKIYRYKIKNYKSTLDQILIKPNRNVLYILAEKAELDVILDNFQSSKSIISINSNQNAGSSKGIINDSITIISNDYLPEDYNDEYYIYSFDEFQTGTINYQPKIYIDQLATGFLPSEQINTFAGNKDQSNNVVQGITLSNFEFVFSGNNTIINTLYEPTLEYFDANNKIELKLDGPLGDFGSEYFDEFNRTRQLEYKLVDYDAGVYIPIQLQPTKISPEINFSSDTFDKNKNLSFDIAQNFINGGSLKNLVFELRTSVSDAYISDAHNALYKMFLTLAFVSYQRLTKFKEFRIDDPDNINLGKIKTDELVKYLYGVAVDDILSIEQNEFNAAIIKTFESDYSELLAENKNLQNAYTNFKAILCMLGEFIPSPYSYGNYSKINRLALEWYFIPEKQNITLADISNPNSFDYKVILKSEKFAFSGVDIKSANEQLLEISRTKIFDLDSLISLPSIPEVLSSESKNTLPGTIDISNTSFLNYLWIFRIPDKTKLQKMFIYDDPFDYSLVQKRSASVVRKETYTITTVNEYKIAVYPKPEDSFSYQGNTNKTTTTTSDLSIAPIAYDVDETTDQNILNELIAKEFLLANRKITSGTESVAITPNNECKKNIFGGFDNPNCSSKQISRKIVNSNDPQIGYETNTKTTTTIEEYTRYQTIVFAWEETSSTASNQEAIKLDLGNLFNFNQAQWETFTTALDIDLNNYNLEPIINEKNNSIRKLKDVYWKQTFSNYAIINLVGINFDGSKKNYTFEFEQAFKKDQTITQEGLVL